MIKIVGKSNFVDFIANKRISPTGAEFTNEQIFSLSEYDLERLVVMVDSGEVVVTKNGRPISSVEIRNKTIMDLRDLEKGGNPIKFLSLPVTLVDDTDNHVLGNLPNVDIQDVKIQVLTAESTGTTKTITVGTAGDSLTTNDPNGFLVGVSVAQTGLISGEPVVTEGDTETYFSSCTKGELLCYFVSGTDSANDHGFFKEKVDTLSGGAPIVYSLGSADFNELEANILVFYSEK